jgi:hypothetical protein
VQRFIEILRDQYGVADAASLFQPFRTSNDVLTLFGRVDWTLNDRHRLSLRHNFAKYDNSDEFFSGGFIFGRSAAEVNENISHSLVGELQSVLGVSTFNVLRFQFANEDRPRMANVLRPTLSVRDAQQLGTQGIGYGGNTLSYHNDLDERKIQLVNNLTHVRGAHTVKVGATALFTDIRNVFARLGSGTYSFTSLDDFANFRPSSYTRILRADGTLPIAEFGVNELGVYVQDEWRATPRLTATLGLRYDNARFRDAPMPVVDAERAFGIETGIAPVDNNNISPRLSLAYDIFGDGTSVARIGGGYFYGRTPYVLGGNVASTSPPTVELICRGDASEGALDAPPSPSDYRTLPLDGFGNPWGCSGGFAAGGAVPTYSFWNQGYEYPETFQANVGFERIFPTRTRASVDFIYAQGTSIYTVRNINVRDVQFELANEGGRRVFQPLEIFAPRASDATINAQNARRNLDFGDVFVNYNDGRSRSVSATTSLTQRFAAASQVQASYTYTSAYDNSSFTCCTSFAGWVQPNVGAFGPNEIGGIGDTDRMWGPSNFVRNHTIVFSGQHRLPFGFLASAFWRMQSGNPWTPE